MSLRRELSGGLFAFALSTCLVPADAQVISPTTQTPKVVSIGDVIKAEEAKASAPQAGPFAAAIGAAGTPAPAATLPPLHLIYVHGINDVGANDSQMLREAICRYVYSRKCTVVQEKRLYAEGPFALTAMRPTLEYLQRPVWSSDEEWHASAPFLQRYRFSGGGREPIVLDELNWYPLVYPLKCKFLLPGDARLTGDTKDKDSVCRPSVGNQPDGSGHYTQYSWAPDPTLFSADTRTQHATWINHSLKVGLMDWGFGDAVLALGPMQEILTAAIRQLLLQSLDNVVPGGGTPRDGENPNIPVFFVTHSLGSYLSLAAMDATSLGGSAPGMEAFKVTPQQQQASDFFASQTTGFYFLANQLSLLELARLAPPPAPQPGDCADPVAEQGATVSASVVVSHYVCMRSANLSRLGLGPQTTGPQIVAWSDANDLLSWYVPAIPGAAVVNQPAHNSAVRVPWILAWPISIHDNYAKNSKVVRNIFGVTPP